MLREDGRELRLASPQFVRILKAKPQAWVYCTLLRRSRPSALKRQPEITEPCPPLVLAGLDPASRRTLWECILEAKRRRTVLLTTHSMEEAEGLCDRIGQWPPAEMQFRKPGLAAAHAPPVSKGGFVTGLCSIL